MDIGGRTITKNCVSFPRLVKITHLIVRQTDRSPASLVKPTPLPKNQIYTNSQYRNKLLGEIYGRTIGLKEIIEAPVSNLDVIIL